MALTTVFSAYYSCQDTDLTVSLVAVLSGITGTDPTYYEWASDGVVVSSGTISATGSYAVAYTTSYASSLKYLAHPISLTASSTTDGLDTSAVTAKCRGEVDMFMDGPIFSADRAIEYPVVKTLDQFDSAVAEGAFLESSVFTRAMRHSVLVPFAGEAPVFNQVPESVKDSMFLWSPKVTDDDFTIVCVAFKGNSGTSYLTPDGEGSLVLRILPDTPGEISGVKCAPYPDKKSEAVGEGPVFFKLSGPAGTSSSTNHMVAKNPYADEDPPITDTYPGEPVGETDVLANPPTSWTAGSDQLKWLDRRAVQFGFRNGEAGNGVRFYLSGCTYETVLELVVLPVASLGALESIPSIPSGNPPATDARRLSQVKPMTPATAQTTTTTPSPVQVLMSSRMMRGSRPGATSIPGGPPNPVASLISAGLPTQAALNAGKVNQTRPKFGRTSGVVGGGGVGIGGHITGFWIGSKRILYFGTQGDKIRWYVSRRCGEPIPYIPAYNITTDAFANPGSNPRECLVGIYDTPPVVDLISGPSYQGLTPPLVTVPDMLSISSLSLTLDRQCVDGDQYPYFLLDTYITGGTAPFTVVAGVTSVSDSNTFSSGPVNFNYATDTLPVTITGVASSGGAFTVSVQVEDAFGVTVTSTGSFTLPDAAACPDSW